MADHDLETFAAMFWAAFGAASGMKIAPECVRWAKDRGYYDNVKCRKDGLNSDEAYLRKTLICCNRAGKYAAEHADGAETVCLDLFKDACIEGEKYIKDLREQDGEKSGKKNDCPEDGIFGTLAAIC